MHLGYMRDLTTAPLIRSHPSYFTGQPKRKAGKRPAIFFNLACLRLGFISC